MAQTATAPILVVFSGRPGVGKTTLSRAVADDIGATFLRIDTIEAAIVSTLTPFSGNPVGYVVAQRVAADQLRAGRPVVADAVNNLDIARQGWTAVAEECAARLRFIEVICSDQEEHRARVEGRAPEMPGHGVPTWDQVQHRPWEPFAEPRLVVDNVGDSAQQAATIVQWLACG
jgi:predicted kinase